MSDLLLLLLRANLAAAAAVGLVMILRRPARRAFGPRIAYGLWSLVPLAALGVLGPARVVTVAASAPAQQVWEAAAPGGDPAAAPASVDPWLLLAGLWIAGGLVSLAHLAWRQRQFGRALRDRRAGPAVIGVLRPRVVTPADFETRYTPKERLVVLAHERIHIARHDSRINAAVALARCLNWFNPAIHLLAHYLRIDQEFACDAQVMAAHPTARRSYAEAMLKAQLAARPLPLGCYWPAPSAHPLAQRIRLLSDTGPDGVRQRLGVAAIALLGLAATGSAWAARPTEVVWVAAEAPAARAMPGASPRADAPAAPRPAPTPRAQARLPPVAEAMPEARLVFADFVRPGANPTPAPEAEPGPAAAEVSPHPVSRIHSVARRSAVEPGSAVRVLATMVDRDGVPLTTDLTAYGSQSAYRTGYFTRKGSRYALFTSVRQQHDKLWVTASLDRDFTPESSGTITLASGQTSQITLGDGQVVTVTPTIRAETPEEIAEAGRLQAEWEARQRDRDARRAVRWSGVPY